MGFITSFTRDLIRRHMEDPAARDKAFADHVYEVKERCKDLQAQWRLPSRPYGFWGLDKGNAKYTTNTKLSRSIGKMDPYDAAAELTKAAAQS
eukprot:jgi/Chlat1/6739/Chrsp50S06440